jgi:uncharacterized membrane protein
MLINLLDIVAVTLASLVLGVFWGPWLALTRSMSTLPLNVFLTVTHRLDHNLGRSMTILYPLTLVAIIAALVFSVPSPIAFWLTIAGLIMFLIALVVTVRIEVPIVAKIREWTDTVVPENWQALRDRWVKFHLLRVIPGIIGVALLTAGAVWQR